MILDLLIQAVATVTLLVGLWLCGNHRRLGPLLASVAELFWVVVFVRHQIWGGIVLSVILLLLQGRNFVKWHKEGVRW